MTTPSSPVAKRSLFEKLKTGIKALLSRVSTRMINARVKLQGMNKKQLRTLYVFVGIAGFLILVLFWVVIFIGVHHHKPVPAVQAVKQQAVLMQKSKMQAAEQNIVPLEKIQKELTELLQKPAVSPEESENHKALQQLSSRLSVLIHQQQSSVVINQKQIAAVINTQQLLAKSNKVVQRQLSEIHKAVTPVHYLPVSTLPFRVEGLSFWNGQPMVTISMVGLAGQHFYKLIGQGGEYGCSYHTAHGHGCASWIVKHINVDSGAVVFANHNGQFVKVSL